MSPATGAGDATVPGATSRCSMCGSRFRTESLPEKVHLPPDALAAILFSEQLLMHAGKRSMHHEIESH